MAARSQNPVLSLRYSDIDIKMTPSEKILGVHVDDNLMWNNHFQHVLKKWLLSKIRSYLSVEHRFMFYNAYVKPHFDYCNAVWSKLQVETSIKYLNYKDVLVN